MKLYLIQHGEAVSKEVDPDRPLSQQGKKDVKNIARFLKKSGIPVNKILHSGKTRARQTAIDDIGPNDSVEDFIETIPTLEDDSMIVGHLPFMAKLVTSLTTDFEDPSVVAYQPGSVVCLEQDEHHNWQIQWMIRPDCL